MPINFEHRRHPRIAARRQLVPPTTVAEHVGLNGRIALVLTTVVGTMWCAYAFAHLRLQDDAINALLDKVTNLESRIGR